MGSKMGLALESGLGLWLRLGLGLGGGLTLGILIYLLINSDEGLS